MATSRSRTPSRRRTKRAPAVVSVPPRAPCSNESTMFPFSKATEANPPIRGKKRARTALTGHTPALAIPSSSSDGRDWANLGGDGPTGLIAELVLANDVADYIRFRAVCRAWRRCTPDPCGGGLLDARFLPRQWIMLDKAHDAAASRRHRFLNVSTGECIRTDLSELADHRLLALTPEGLLLLLDKRTLVVRLLNPLTRQLTDLPPATALLPKRYQRAWRAGCSSLEDMIMVSGVGLADASTVAVRFLCPIVLAVARPGDKRWTVVESTYIHSSMSCAGRFYCAEGSNVMVLDTSCPDKQPPRLRLVATERTKPFVISPVLSDSFHLVDNAGELMLVHRTLAEDAGAQGAERYKQGVYEVFRVDLDAGTLTPAKDLRGRAVFTSLSRTVCVSPWAFSSVTADTLYLGFDCAEKTAARNAIDGYNVADGSSEPRYHYPGDERLARQPCSLVDYLSYCIQCYSGHLA